jgi:hypothetical protein
VSGVLTSAVTSFFDQVTTSTGTTSEVLNNRSGRGAVISAGVALRVFFPAQNQRWITTLVVRKTG